MKAQQYYSRFRAWQHQPVRFENKVAQPTKCACCGTEYADNYCPRCGQKAGAGRVTWESLRQNVMMLWGMESRSLLFTLLQLLLRPGYLIGDYLDGKRQMSFPPVKALFIVAIAYLLVEHLCETYLGYKPSFNEESADILDRFDIWTHQNPAWGELLLNGMMLLPTWFLFRFSPRHTRHTLPEGFFIQIFMSIISLIFTLIFIMERSGLVAMALMFLYILIAYKQLFGYGWWGTIWRLLLCIVVAGYTATTMYILLSMEQTGIESRKRLVATIVVVLLLLIMVLIPSVSAYFIGKRSSKH